uniref:Phlebovirus_G2 domain-containing protein n=1 Tax=Heligmosomoides polygyrus TaxID=6339 RepID=A0A183FUE8_HELPZ
LWSELAILVTLICTSSSGCQQVDIYDHQILSCYRSDKGESCHADTSAIAKIKPFKQEACLRLTSNDTTLIEMKLLWRSLELTCERESLLFSRSTRYALLDSKRCPHTLDPARGRNVEPSPALAELQKANDYPGVTGCVESCGGPGCDCLYPSSGCFFYRIYLIPNDNAVYEVFRCTRWKPSVYLEIAINGPHHQEKLGTLHLIPNQPQIFPPLTVTLSSLSVPPLPILSSRFISDGNRTAIAPAKYDPPLKCRSSEEALNMTCTVEENCKCEPAEIKMVCDCNDFNLTAHMLNPAYRLPILRPNLEFTTRNGHLVSKVLHSTTAEFVVRIKDQLRIISVISNAVCTGETAYVRSCYKCAKGVRAMVKCTSSTQEERAEIRCGDQAFTVKCTSQGAQTELRFNADKARFDVECSVQCGQSTQIFKIVGILRYTGSIYTSARRMLNGEREVFSEINLPNFGHLIDVFLKWTGTLLITVIAVILALLATYFCIANTACFFLLKLSLRLAWTVFRVIFCMLWNVASTPLLVYRQARNRMKKEEEKLL